MGWNEESARERIREAVASCDGIEVSQLVRDVELTTVPLKKGYEVDGVHVYVDIVNVADVLGRDSEEQQEACLHFLHVFERVAHAVMRDSDARKVDFQNSRLHFVIWKPYDEEKQRIEEGLRLAVLFRDLLVSANGIHPELHDVQVAVGIESGLALAVNNGTRGDREPLFLGNPANRAAKLLGKHPGIFVGPRAANVLGGSWVSAVAANASQLQDYQDAGALKRLLAEWEKQKDAWIETVGFSSITPPLADLDVESLSLAKSKRRGMAVIYADVDGFSAYVEKSLRDETTAAHAVCALHVIRKELRDVLRSFGGRKIRYAGDCIHGVLAIGSALDTDAEDTVIHAAACAAAMLSSFELIRNELGGDAAALGLQVGIDFGDVAISRVGVKGSLDRVMIGSAVIGADAAQRQAAAGEIVYGAGALAAGGDALKKVLPEPRSMRLDYTGFGLKLLRLLPEIAHVLEIENGPPPSVYPRAHSRL